MNTPKDITLCQTIYDSLRSETVERIARYSVYLDWYRGKHEIYMNIPGGRPVHKTNLSRRSVQMLAAFTFPDLFGLHIKRPSETSGAADEAGKVPDYETEIQNAERQEKILRKWLQYKKQGKIRLKKGMESGLVLGDTVFYVTKEAKTGYPCIQGIFPGHVRVKFKSDNFEEIEDVFVDQVMTTEEVRRRWNVRVGEVKPENVDVMALWDSTLMLGGGYTVVTTHIDDTYKQKYCGYIQLEGTSPHNMSGVPVIAIPALENVFSPWGVSYLEDIIPINKEHNEAISDEAAIAKIFARPKVIISNATQKEVDAMKSMWESGVVASRNNLNVQPFQFTGQMFPIEQRISKIEDRFFRQSGLGPAVFGQPNGSINTGASLTIQFAPTLQQAGIVWGQWEPRMMKMINYIVDILKMLGTDPDSGKSYASIFKNPVQVELKTPFQLPRDEAIIIQNETVKYQNRMQSMATTMQNIGIESPQDEMSLRTWEDIVLAQILPQQVQNAGKQTTPPSSPQAGAMAGGQMVANAALGVAPPPPSPLSSTAAQVRASQFLSSA